VQVQDLEAAVAKDHKQLANSLTATAIAAKKKLQEKFKAIEELSDKYQQVMVLSVLIMIMHLSVLSVCAPKPSASTE
jgi:dihydrodipicolinate synthase/N-acetylneuraminate lyase